MGELVISIRNYENDNENKFIMEVQIIIVNIINLIAGICSIISVQWKIKKQIVFIEFIGTTLRLINNFLVKSWSDLIAKIIKGITQVIDLKNKLNKSIFFISFIYTFACLNISTIRSYNENKK